MRNVILFCAALVLSTLLFTRDAAAIEGYRGSTWGELRFDLPRENPENLLMAGWIKQGIDWKRWGNATLNTYATLRYKWDTEKYDWNNALEPGIGIAIDVYCPKGLVGMAGVEYIWENRFLDNDWVDSKAVIYVSWYGWWDLKN